MSTRPGEDNQTRVSEYDMQYESDEELDFEPLLNMGDADLLIPKDNPKRILNKLKKKKPL